MEKKITTRKKLIATLLENSDEQKDLKTAISEWYVADCEVDNSKATKCVCGQEGLKYIFTIVNEITGAVIAPIGSSCVKLFDSKQLNDEMNYLVQKHLLISLFKAGKPIPFNAEYFSRKLLIGLRDEGAFKPNKYNNYNGDNDFEFMTKMFNKIIKSAITIKQRRKIGAVVEYSIKPALLKDAQ